MLILQEKFDADAYQNFIKKQNLQLHKFKKLLSKTLSVKSYEIQEYMLKNFIEMLIEGRPLFSDATLYKKEPEMPMSYDEIISSFKDIKSEIKIKIKTKYFIRHHMYYKIKYVLILLQNHHYRKQTKNFGMIEPA